MEKLVQTAHFVLPVLYGLCTLLYARAFNGRNESDQLAKQASPALLVTFIIHWSSILGQALILGQHPLVGTGAVLNIISIGLVSAYLYVEHIEHHRQTGMFIIGAVTLLQWAGIFFGRGHLGHDPFIANNPIFGLHIILAVVGYAGFALGALYAALYLALYRRLKNHQFDVFFQKLPPLDVLSNMGFLAGVLGWLALGGAIILGILISLQFPERFGYFYVDPQFVVSILVWLVYAAAVLMRVQWGWRGTRSAYMSVFGFLLAISTFMGREFLWDSFHRFLA